MPFGLFFPSTYHGISQRYKSSTYKQQANYFRSTALSHYGVYGNTIRNA